MAHFVPSDPTASKPEFLIRRLADMHHPLGTSKWFFASVTLRASGARRKRD